VTIQDARNKLSEFSFKGKRPTTLRCTLHNDGKTVQDASIWAERALLWSWPDNFKPDYPGAFELEERNGIHITKKRYESDPDGWRTQPWGQIV
jgi:hypothetical protein